MNWFKKKKKPSELSAWTARRVAEIEAQPASDWAKWKENKYAQRLIKEWLTYGKIVLACDFDDTVFGWGFTSEKDIAFFKRVIEVIRLAQEIGCYTTIWSACSSERFEYIRGYANVNGFKVDSINENPIPLPYGNHRKMYYNHLLDDRAGLEQALDMLEYVCYQVRCLSKAQSNNFDT